MHPFHRLSRYVPSHKSCSNQRKEGEGVDGRDKYECVKQRNTSPCRRRLQLEERESEGYPVSVPLIKVTQGETEMSQSRKTNDILKAKEMALWSNMTSHWSDNSERLGPNKNRIIEESLRSNK